MWILPVLLPLGGVGCSERTRAGRPGPVGWLGTSMPDELPQIANAELPFRYPIPLFLQKIQGNVLLRLFVSPDGRVVTDSTRVVESSGQAALDSAALVGSAQLQFRPARRRGVPIAVSLLFPVHFRHPEGPRLPGDTL